MKCSFFIIFLIIVLAVSVGASDLSTDISAELNLDGAKEFIPEKLNDGEIDFSPSATPAENGLTVNSLLKTVTRYGLDGLKNEISFVMMMTGILVVSSVLNTFITNGAMLTAVRFVISATVSVLLTEHIEGAFLAAEEGINDVSVFMTGMLPFIGSVSLAGGEISTAAVHNAVLIGAIDLLQSFLANSAIPACKIIVAFSIAGYISGIPFGAVSEFITDATVKIITLSCGFMCAILYFQNTVSSATDSLALRSVKLMAGSFIPLVGSFVSESTGTLFAGVKLVKSTFGIFAICVLFYLSLQPIINFCAIKLSVRFASVIAKLLGCDKESKVLSETSFAYNILSAVMIASVCFFIFSISIFIKNEVK